ncbi:MAG: hypothetical protein OEY14_09025, partial [Myxococcales bacterium]|nr:hypothetical protein [Myxococcales bacterium]
SFLNPGDIEVPGGTPLPDPCVGFACGAGTCVSMNMTPTCVCDEGLVAVGALDADGSRLTTCVGPVEPVPDAFYDRRLPERPVTAHVGRDYVIEPPPVPSSGGGCSLLAGAGMAPGGAPLAALGLLGLLWLGVRRRGRA